MTSLNIPANPDEDFPLKGTLAWVSGHGYLDIRDITRISVETATVFTLCEIIPVSPEYAARIKSAHREFKIRQVLEQIVKVSDTPQNCEECLPHNALAAVARDAKALIKFLSE